MLWIVPTQDNHLITFGFIVFIINMIAVIGSGDDGGDIINQCD